jgi:hypothetical protein
LLLLLLALETENSWRRAATASMSAGSGTLLVILHSAAEPQPNEGKRPG